MKTGIVVDIRANKAVILKPGGHFCHLQVPSKSIWNVGDVVSLSTPRNQFRTFLAIASFFFLTLIGLGSYHFYFFPATLISLDINPAFELKLNRLEQVIAIDAKNEDATRLLSKVAFPRHSAYEIVWLGLLETAYLPDSSAIAITVFSKDTKATQDYLLKLQQLTHDTLDSQIISIECHLVDRATIEMAHSHGVTAGKYLLVKQLLDLSSDFSFEEYASSSISDIKHQIEECKSTHGTPNNTNHGSHHR